MLEESQLTGGNELTRRLARVRLCVGGGGGGENALAAT